VRPSFSGQNATDRHLVDPEGRCDLALGRDRFEAPDFSNLQGRELRSAMALPPKRTPEPGGVCVQGVLAARGPFQIFEPVVGFDTVLVVDLRPREIGRGQEGQGQEPVNPKGAAFTVGPIEANPEVSFAGAVAPAPASEDRLDTLPGLGSQARDRAPHQPGVGNFIILEARDWFPSYHTK